LIDKGSNIYKYLSGLYDEDYAEKYIEFINENPVPYIRVNTLKTSSLKLAAALEKEYGITSEEIPGIPGSLKITGGRELIGKTIEHIIGEYYIQGLSSMLPPLVLSPEPGEKVLDLCAAPGSKTTQLGGLMNNRGTLIANEIALDRVKMLVYNLDRMNIVNAGVTHTKGEWLSKIYYDYFDKILVDAPCSGLGIIQKKNEVSNWWSLERAERLGDLQLRLLIAAVKMVKPGGEIVYSTCTITPEENEFIVDKVLQKYPVEILDIELPVKSTGGFTEYNGVKISPSLSKSKRIVPWEANSDGFFIVKLKKIGDTVPPEQQKTKPSPHELLGYGKKRIKDLLKNVSATFGIDENVLSLFKYMIKKNNIYFIDTGWEEDNLGMFERIGTRFGTIDKNGNVVLHTQAVQVLKDFITNGIYELETRDELKKYMEGGIIKKDIAAPGQCAIKYNDYMLGTAAVTGAGIKSRFPRAKRTQDIYLDF
jgi:16S rRNA (cytosine1407-C5)-methyltransferase